MKNIIEIILDHCEYEKKCIDVPIKKQTLILQITLSYMMLIARHMKMMSIKLKNL